MTTDETAVAPWVVWSIEHRAWWGPDHCGYTEHVTGAGIYTEAEAKHIERNARSGGRECERAMSLADALNEEPQRAGVRPGSTVLTRIRALEARQAELVRDGERLDLLQKWAEDFVEAGESRDVVRVEVFDDDGDPPREWNVTGPRSTEERGGFFRTGTGSTLRKAIDHADAARATPGATV